MRLTALLVSPTRTTSRLVAGGVVGVLLATAVMAVSRTSSAQAQISITLAPPDLPVHEQPAIPQDGFLWTPGYWEYGSHGYSWIEGQWLQPPEMGMLWTPGYWRWSDGVYLWSAGYWDREVGYYGGVDYGYGYGGRGYQGGYWNGGAFYYNRTVTNVAHADIHHMYARPIESHYARTRVSYNGGRGGVVLKPTAAESARAQAPRQRGPTEPLTQHDRSEGTGSAIPRGSVRDGGSIARVVHVSELPVQHQMEAPSTGDKAQDQSLQSELVTLHEQQSQERASLQQHQQDDHRLLDERGAPAQDRQRTEQDHQSQTEALSQRHSAQQDGLREAQQRARDTERAAEHH